MSGVWTNAISNAWGVFASLMGDFLPIIGLAVGLGIFGAVVAMFMRRGPE